MNNITITISRDHYDLILKAIDYYNEGIKQRLADQSQVVKTQQKSADAPYGYKKDGTPKQRPGRKSA